MQIPKIHFKMNYEHMHNFALAFQSVAKAIRARFRLFVAFVGCFNHIIEIQLNGMNECDPCAIVRLCRNLYLNASLSLVKVSFIAAAKQQQENQQTLLWASD